MFTYCSTSGRFLILMTSVNSPTARLFYNIADSKFRKMQNFKAARIFVFSFLRIHLDKYTEIQTASPICLDATLSSQSQLSILNYNPTYQVWELISSDNLQAESEDLVFEAVMSWVKYDVTNRRTYLQSLFSAIRLPLIPIRYLLKKVSTSSWGKLYFILFYYCH